MKLKIPGILSRISFLVVINSLFMFAVLTYISFDNEESTRDQLLSKHVSGMARFFALELSRAGQAAELDSPSAGDNIIQSLFDNSQEMITGLAGVSILKRDKQSGKYLVTSSRYRPSFKDLENDLKIRAATEYSLKRNRDGHHSQTADARFHVIYIPYQGGADEYALAVTYIPGEMLPINSEYRNSIVLLFLILTLLTLLIINLLFRNFIRPLRDLITGMESMTRGENQYQIKNVRRDEIGRVASVFNSMSAGLWEKQHQLFDSNKNLKILNKKLTETLRELSDANISVAESEAFLGKLVENSPFAIIATNDRGRILTFSKSAATTFETDQEENMGKDIFRFFPINPENVLPDDKQDQTVSQLEMICCKENGEKFPALVSRVPIVDQKNQVCAYLFIIRDITESKSFHEMTISIDRLTTRGMMAGEIAHEINNYLAVILGNVELLPLFLARGDHAKVEQKLEVLRETVARIQTFGEGLMGYGNEEAIFELGDLNQVIGNMVAFLKPQNRYDNIRFDIDLSSEISLIEFDSGQLQQLFVNLLNNAADALREIKGEKIISISTRPSSHGSGADVVISDNAEGLPDDIGDVIFKERYSGKRRGRGFGLMIVGMILDKHNGKISYESNPENGTRFVISLPKRIEPVLGTEIKSANSQVTT